MEELVLTTPEVVPEKVTATYKVVTLTLNWESLVVPETVAGLVAIGLRNEHSEAFNYVYTGQAAKDYIKFINTANFTTKSLHKRILEKLSTDGVLPGTVTGVPDP
jgi:hypothetical protein